MFDQSNQWQLHKFDNPALTRREVEVVRLVAQGLPNKAVAGELSVREGTIKIHLYSIYRKLRVSTRAELILHVIANTRKVPRFGRAAS